MEKNFKVSLRYEIQEDKQDAIWFYGDRHHGTVSLETEDGKKFDIDIYLDGETRYEIPRFNIDGTYDLNNRDVVRYQEDWHEQGIYTDKEIQEIYDLWLERGFEIHFYNSWFDLYTEIDGVSEHLDAVTHTQTEAVEQAKVILQEVAAHGSWKKYLETLY